MAEVRSALEGEDSDRIRTASEALSQALQEIGQAAYGAAAGADGVPGANGDGAEPADESEGEGEAAGTVEGEFREV